MSLSLGVLGVALVIEKAQSLEEAITGSMAVGGLSEIIAIIALPGASLFFGVGILSLIMAATCIRIRSVGAVLLAAIFVCSILSIITGFSERNYIIVLETTGGSEVERTNSDDI